MIEELVVWEGPSKFGGRCFDCGVRIPRGSWTCKVWTGEKGTNRGGQGPGRYVCKGCAVGFPRRPSDPKPVLENRSLFQ